MSHIFHFPWVFQVFIQKFKFPWVFPEILTIFQILWICQVFHVFQISGHPTYSTICNRCAIQPEKPQNKDLWRHISELDNIIYQYNLDFWTEFMVYQCDKFRSHHLSKTVLQRGGGGNPDYQISKSLTSLGSRIPICSNNRISVSLNEIVHDWILKRSL